MPITTTSTPSRYRPTNPVSTIPDDLPVFLDVRTAAEVGNFSEKFVRDQIRAGAIPGIKIGGAWRINRDAYFKVLGIA